MVAKNERTKANSLKSLVNESEGVKHSEKMLGDIAEMIKSKGIDLASI